MIGLPVGTKSEGKALVVIKRLIILVVVGMMNIVFTSKLVIGMSLYSISLRLDSEVEGSLRNIE